MIKRGDKVWLIASFWKNLDRGLTGVPFVYVYRYPNWIILPKKLEVRRTDKKWIYFDDCGFNTAKREHCFKRLSDAKKAIKIMNNKERTRFVKDIVTHLEKRMV